MSSLYKAIKVNGKKVDEHRYIMEQFIGRKLTRNEVVHHKNGNKRDNRIENLEVQLLSDHSRNHMIGVPMSKETRKKISETTTGRINPYRKLSEADVLFIRKNYIPNDREFGQRALSRKFNVSRATISDALNNRYYKNFVVQ